MTKKTEIKHTKFEYARLIGARALQISAGAPPLVRTKEQDSIKIAKLEYQKGRLPLKVKRKMPKAKKKDTKVLVKKF